MPHEHKLTVWKNATIEVGEPVYNLSFLKKLTIKIDDTIVNVLHCYESEIPNNFADVKFDIGSYQMKFPVNNDEKITWICISMAYIFIEETTPNFPVFQPTLLHQDISGNYKFGVQALSSDGRPICKPFKDPKKFFPKLTQNKTLNFKIDLGDSMKDYHFYPSCSIHDPNMFGHHPNLGEEIFGFYVISKDEKNVEAYFSIVRNHHEFSHPGPIGHDNRCGYYIII